MQNPTTDGNQFSDDADANSLVIVSRLAQQSKNLNKSLIVKLSGYTTPVVPLHCQLFYRQGRWYSQLRGCVPLLNGSTRDV